MALAKKCDRCGKYYTPYNTRGDGYNAIRMVKTMSDNRIYKEDYVKDLCPDCFSEIDAFINLYSDREENDNVND